METKHTPGPWYFDGHGAIWRRPPSDLYENGGEVAGDRPIATVHIGWHHDGAIGYPVEANARLIAAAPALLEALVALFNDYKRLADSGDAGFWNLEDVPEGKQALAAIAKARGETC